MRGVDISHWQKGLTILQLREEGFSFAILKVTEGTGLVDDAAFPFYREAYELGFPTGCYCYSHAVNAQQAMAEAAFLLDAISGFPMPCGIFLDIEEPKTLELDHDAILNVIRGWCAGIGGRGYIPGVYSSEGTLWSKISPDELPDGCLVWVAKWSETQPNTPCDLWQNSDSGRVKGYDGNVDTDLSRSVRFETLVDTGGCDYQYHHQRKQESRDPPDADPPDACPIDRPCDSGPDVAAALRVLADYLSTEEFVQNFKNYIEKRKKK
jgi:GH25 family lysozyme M1 (1,4-beta-N-acetylmuramidase)